MPELRLTFVAILTTGPSPVDDPIVEAAGCRLDGEDTFEELADPGDVPAAVRKAIGLKPGTLAGKRDPRQVIDDLFAFCKGTSVVVWDAPAFAAFVEGVGLPTPDRLDARRLAQIVRPGLSEYSLGAVARALEMEEARRALPSAQLLARIWSTLLDELADLPSPALDAVCRIAEGAGDPLAPVLEEAAARRGNLELTADPEQGLADLFPDNRKLLQQAQKFEAPEPKEEPIPTDGICDMLTSGGAVGRRLPNYEQRAEQVDMLRAVCDAMNEGRHLMVEAGTGTGKSMAYLLPAVAWSVTNGDKVMVSTNTRNLQEQLFRKDLPFLTGLMPGRFRGALLKGRRNYLCVRRFMHMMRHFQRELAEREEVQALLPVVVWAARTVSGDMAECNGLQLNPAAPAVIPTITTGRDECAGRACRFRSRCFVGRARALAHLADVIVVNHAVLFAELGLDSRVLPPYRCVIFDEAHNLEDVATEALATTVDGRTVFRITNFLHRRRRDGSGSGLLATVMHEASRLRAPANQPLKDRLTDLGGEAMAAVEGVVDSARQFLDVIGEPFMELPPSAERVLLQECNPGLFRGSDAWSASEGMRDQVSTLGEKVEPVCEALADASEEITSAEELSADLRAQVALLREVCQAAEFVLTQDDDGFVYWLERTTRGRDRGRDRRTYHAIRAAPLRIGELIRNFFFHEKRNVIMTSATLQVDGSFDYMLERVGADSLQPGHIECMAVGSPFDYERQALVGVTTFLPDPGGRRDRMFDQELSSFLIDLLQCTKGRALILSTSYSLLNAVYDTVKEPLERAGIKVLAQGQSGSREAVTSVFRSETSSVLLGTRSFWEGVDISGEALSCLVLTKLPFHVFTDPLVRGRTEYLRNLGRDPFMHYTLPEAVISFRQGFGRLIRTRTDVGVILVADRRLVTKGYGRIFLNSLPARHQVFKTREEALEEIGAFFERAGGA